MRIFLLAFLTLFTIGCKSDTKISSAEAIPSVSNVTDDTSVTNNTKEPAHQWSKKDQKKFLAECESGAEQHLSEQKLKDFCSCMLLQSQKYYSTYREMEHKSNDEFDIAILEGCSEYVEE